MRSQVVTRVAEQVACPRCADTNEVGGLTETGVLEGVRYVQCPMDGTEGTLLAANRAALPQVFAVLADESNYHPQHQQGGAR